MNCYSVYSLRLHCPSERGNPPTPWERENCVILHENEEILLGLVLLADTAYNFVNWKFVRGVLPPPPSCATGNIHPINSHESFNSPTHLVTKAHIRVQSFYTFAREQDSIFITWVSSSILQTHDNKKKLHVSFLLKISHSFHAFLLHKTKHQIIW